MRSFDLFPSWWGPWVLESLAWEILQFHGMTPTPLARHPSVRKNRCRTCDQFQLSSFSWVFFNSPRIRLHEDLYHLNSLWPCRSCAQGHGLIGADGLQEFLVSLVHRKQLLWDEPAQNQIFLGLKITYLASEAQAHRPTDRRTTRVQLTVCPKSGLLQT